MRAKCHWCEDAGRSCSPWEWLSVPESCPSTPSSLPLCLTLPRLQPQKSSHLLGLSRYDNSFHVRRNGNIYYKKSIIITISIVFITSDGENIVALGICLLKYCSIYSFFTGLVSTWLLINLPSPFQVSEHISRLQDFVAAMTKLQPDEHEYAYLKTIVLFQYGEYHWLPYINITCHDR